MPVKEGTRILLIVSDLHLSQGWDEKTKKLDTKEDFFFDKSFERFLRCYSKKAKEENSSLRLIIAGDFVDLLQVSPPKENEFKEEDITPREHEFGLGTSPKKSCWKLGKVINGHWIFFRSLAEFLAEGNEVVIIPGNHDIEFALPEVQNYFKTELSKLSSDFIVKNLSFYPWFYYQPGLVYIEHGHQYDSLNSFDYFLYPFLPDKLIDLPAGSFFVRYLFNKVETLYPFADNMKPVTRFLRWSLGKPLLWFQIRRYIRFFFETLMKAGPLDSGWVPELEKEHQRRLLKIAKDQGIKEETLLRIKSKWEKSVIHHLGKFKLLLRLIGRGSKSSSYYDIAKLIKEILGVKYVIFGHTHEADIIPLEDKPGGAEYVNSGTWTKVFAENFEERLLKEENEFVFVMIKKENKSPPKMELLKWRDDLGEGERVRLFAFG